MANSSGPLVLGRAKDTLLGVSAGDASPGPIVPSNMAGLVTGLEELVLVSGHLRSNAPALKGTFNIVPDGNRGAFLPELTIELYGRRFLIGLKGIGARYPMYEGMFGGAGPIGQVSAGHTFSSESWFGESPWGAMSYNNCMEDKTITELGGPDGINGFHICPMARANPLPSWIMDEARPRFWYRRLNGPMPYYQQVRLMPSNVRLFYQSEEALGQRTSRVLDGFKVQGHESLDSFIDNYLRSGLAALTLMARTVRPHDTWGYTGLDYDDVWLDKDSVIAPDGTIFFADIEGLDWVPLRDGPEASKRMRKQFDRNFYEFMYGLDRLVNERDSLSQRTVDRESRRQELAARLELAVGKDRFLSLERNGPALDAVMRPTIGPVKEVRARMLDFENDPIAYHPKRLEV